MPQTITLDGDEIGAALIGDRLGQQSLSAAGRSIEENALTRGHAELMELLGMLDGEQDHFLETLLGLLKSFD